MSKQFILAFIILFGLMFFLSSEKCFSEVALFKQAETYTASGCIQQAKEIYDSIVTDYPATGHALKAQAELIILSIHKKTDSEIQRQIDGLIAGYSEHTTLPAALCLIARGYAWAGRLQQGKALYQQIIQDYPDSPAVSEAQIGISRTDILSLIKAGNYTTAADEVNKLITAHSSSEYLPATLYHIARGYQWVREFDHAKSVLQRIMQVYPQSPQAARAQFYIERADILSLIKSGNYTQASAKLDQFKQNFSGHPGLPTALWGIVREYEKHAKYEDARNVCEQVITQYPEHPYAYPARLGFTRTKVLYLVESGNYTAVENELDKLRHADARNIYEQIIVQYPNRPYADKARLGFSKTNILSLIDSGNYTVAGTECNKLIEDFSGYPELPGALYDIAIRYGWSEKYTQATAIHQQIIQNYPDSPAASEAQLGISRIKAASFIKSEDYTAAAAELAKLVKDFSGHSGLPSAFYDIGRKYEWSGQYERAKNIYQQIIRQYPGSMEADKAQLDFPSANVLSLIETRQEAAAQAAIDSLIADFNGYPELPKAVLVIGERCYNRARKLEKDDPFDQSKYYFEKAAEIWQTMIKEFPAFIVTPASRCWAGDSYRKLGKYEESSQCFQKVVNNCPRYKFAWHAMFTIGLNYESLKKAGVISKSEADLKTKAAYQQVLENYPGCPASKYVKSWINNNL